MTTTDSTLEAGAVESVNTPDRLVRAGLFVVLVACIVASGDVLIDLAHRAAWNDWRAWLLPILIDLPGFLGGRIWLRRAPTLPDTRRYAKRLTLAALGASIVGNTTGHLLKADKIDPGVALVIVCSVIAPIVLWAVLHLDALLAPADPAPAEAQVAGQSAKTSAASTPADPPAASPAPAARPAAASTTRPAPPTAVNRAVGKRSAKAPTGGKARARAHWDAEIAAGREPTGAELARVSDVDPSLGRRWARAWKTENTTDTETSEEAA
jgi:hypothetical protein